MLPGVSTATPLANLDALALPFLPMQIRKDGVALNLFTSIATLGTGRSHYLALCAGCHAAQGQGKPNVTVALAGNSTVRNPDPHNLLHVMLHGLEQKDFPGNQSRQAMPGFADALDNAQMAELANYLRVEFGGQKGDVSGDTVAKLR
ncbi:cbb3-type cytochrome c oxidase subunit III [Pusillimonas sp. T7-7]|uniref:c-type cytochrome n=1 Tax=Pusillimonas sp. (strain T7-7) TaxID=1007105 RepID=UPI0002084B9A|nr:cytochrome c [Pusillimonas sp. T7-7]AEC21687.1 cbb3-type cytochrome c oxidase subunit III [Pusillimonas sp. T7-7]